MRYMQILLIFIDNKSINFSKTYESTTNINNFDWELECVLKNNSKLIDNKWNLIGISIIIDNKIDRKL